MRGQIKEIHFHRFHSLQLSLSPPLAPIMLAAKRATSAPPSPASILALPTALRCHILSRRALATTTTDSPSDPRAPPYATLLQRLHHVRRLLPRTHRLTLAEKILFSHLADPEASLLPHVHNGTPHIRGHATLKLHPDRVAMQDASAQMALLQFMTCRLPSTAVPASIHCDHMIVGTSRGADVDLPASLAGNGEVYDFLESAARKYGIEFWPPGAGIIHQAVLENYAAPGLMMLGTDSHTPNAGGLGAIAIGVGGADAVDALVASPWELTAPKILGVRLEGHLSGWTTPKDIILHLAGRLTVRGGTGYILEYHGPGLAALSCTGMATACNMGAEVGATTSLFPFTPAAHEPYLRATHRGHIAEQAMAIAARPDEENLLAADAGAEYDEEIVVDLDKLEPHINGPFTPDLSTPLSKFKDTVRANAWPETFGAGLIGSCTNSSYADMSRSASLVAQASAAGLKPRAAFYITPGSEQIRATIARDGMMDVFEEAGGRVLANACGPCIGQWDRADESSEVKKGATNAIFTSYNRNFPGRNDGNRATMNFLASPEVVTAMAYAGSTTFNPLTDSIPIPATADNGGVEKEFRFQPPTGADLPPATHAFALGNPAFRPTVPDPDPSISVAISPSSTRLAALQPFPPFPPHDLPPLRILVKVAGQCTTDTISAAGPWLKYKGHLPNIAANTLIGAVSADTGRVNCVRDVDNDGGKEYGIPELAHKWQSEGREWMVVAEHNYGEGSAREHAALQPRFLGCRVVLAKSFARIHEANLKKQGVVPLRFVDEGDYERMKGGDEVVVEGLYEMLRKEGEGEVSVVVGGKERIPVRCELSPDQCGFILAGSALNVLAARAARAGEV